MIAACRSNQILIAARVFPYHVLVVGNDICSFRTGCRSYVQRNASGISGVCAGHVLYRIYGTAVFSHADDVFFAVFKSVGFDKELAELKKLLEERLAVFPNPVPADKTFEDWFTEIWGSSKLMEVPVYGYLQFKSVLIAMDDDGDLESWFAAMGIDGFKCPNDYKSDKYPIGAKSAIDNLNNLQSFFKSSGLKVPTVGIELTDSPMTHFSQKMQ